MEEFVKKNHVNVHQSRGEIIEVTPQVISEISGILSEWELINKGHINFHEVINSFHQRNERKPILQVHNGSTKGINRSSMDEPWKTAVLWLMKFFTYEGQDGTMLVPSMRLLIHLRYANTRPEAWVNLPSFLFLQISSMVARVKEKDGHIKYPGLIHIIVKHHFLKNEVGKEKWLEFLSSPVNRAKKGSMLKSLKIEKGEPSKKGVKRASGNFEIMEEGPSHKKGKNSK